MHRFLRTTGLASLGLAAALLAGGCSSGGSDKASDKASDKPSGSPSATAPGRAPATNTPPPAATSGGSGASAAPGGKASTRPGAGAPAAAALDGNWVAVTQNKPVALVIKGGNAAVLGEHQCSGTTSSAAGSATLHLTCKDGNTSRTRGTARLNGAKLEVSWAGFGKDEFTRNKTGG
ncbi:hypothetical protein [Streptomyces sp. NBC_00083]|uniref:hypothetical protein n=1 Tax=Streptomyces sp. NBC_00083 TaxID=2975647 RepID=UPI0022521B15|nr:hypothetical protein [Streptomyces sp. NBC_00083]MCX5384045.1 hypothetical protein [Streptomyces sp. NBC_00083]